MAIPKLSIGQIIFLYLLALVAVVSALVVHPHSQLLFSMLLFLLFLFFAVAFAVILVAALYIISLLAGRLGFSALRYVLVRVAFWEMNQRSQASDPARTRLDLPKLRRLCPEYFVETGGDALAWLDARFGKRAASVFLVDDQLTYGDSRAAVVVSVSPLLIAAYSDELDCVALLRFPDELVSEYDLRLFSRLLTVNRYMIGGPLVADLEIGRLGDNRYANFQPFIAEFLSSDTERIRERKATITEEEWRRTITLGRRYLDDHGTRARDGRPASCMIPAG
jgi:hypothetical protein